MARFLLWNVQRKALDNLILEAVARERIDAVLLVEYDETNATVRTALTSAGLEVVHTDGAKSS